MPFPPTPSMTPSNTATPSVTPSNTNTNTPTESVCPGLTPTASSTLTKTPTRTPTLTPTELTCNIYTIQGLALDAYYTGTTCAGSYVNTSIGLSTIETECIQTGSLFVYEGTINSFTGCTIPPTATPTITPTLTKTPTLSPSQTASQTSTAITATPTQTQTVTPSSITLFEFTGCGYGASVGAACSDSGNNRTFYSECSTITAGCTIYYPSYPTILTGYSHVFVDGAVWEINSSTGVIIQISATQC